MKVTEEELERMVADRARMRWICVGTALPRYSGLYLAVDMESDEGNAPFVCVFRRRVDGDCGFGAHVTHWMPLPSLPETGGDWRR